MQTLQKHKPLKEKHIAYIVASTAQGLAYLHRAGIVHADIKPTNLLVTQQAQVKLADFGVSVFRHDPSLATGTLLFLAPEVLQPDGTHDTSSDIWSLGITCLALADGKKMIGQPPSTCLCPV